MSVKGSCTLHGLALMQIVPLINQRQWDYRYLMKDSSWFIVSCYSFFIEDAVIIMGNSDLIPQNTGWYLSPSWIYINHEMS